MWFCKMKIMMESDPKKRMTLLRNDLNSTLFKCVSYPSDVFNANARELLYVADVKHLDHEG